MPVAARRTSTKPIARPSSRLAPHEQQALRKAGLRKAELADMPPAYVAKLTQLPLPRCKELIALSQFSRLESVGPATAEDLVVLGYESIASLRRAKPPVMYDRLCAIQGTQLDPCVEDVFYAVVAQARDPELPAEQRNWWYWTERRKRSGKPAGKRAQR